MKKLAILIYSMANGGAERVVSTLLFHLRDNYELTLVLMNSTLFYPIPQDIKVIYLENSNPHENGFKKLLKLPLLAFKYNTLLKKENIDISLSFTSRPNYINVLTKLLGTQTKIIVNERSTPSELYKNRSLQSYINKLLIKILYPKAHIVLTNSNGNARDLQQNFNIKKCKTVYNPFNITNIQKLGQEEINISKKQFTFVTIGRLDHGKNHQLIIDSICDLNASLWIIGSGELKEELTQYIDNLNLQNRVFLLDKQQNPFKYLTKADCFIFSSNYEGFPNVLIEALSCNLPVISTDCKSGPREILAPNTSPSYQLKNGYENAQYGLLTPIKNKSELIKTMRLIMENTDLREHYKSLATIRASDFHVYKIKKKYIEVLNETRE